MPGPIAPPWSPRNRKIAARNARLHRLKAKGLTPAGDKASLRAAAQLATTWTPSAPYRKGQIIADVNGQPAKCIKIIKGR